MRSSITGGSAAPADWVVTGGPFLLKRSRRGGSRASGTHRSADFLGRERGDSVDVGGVDERARGVHIETREAVLLGQADVEDRDIALKVGLLVDDQILIALLDRLRRVRRHVEAGEEHLPRLERRGARVDADIRRQAAVVGDDDLDSRIGAHDPDERRGAGVRIGVGRRIDLLVDHLRPGLGEGVDHADGALAAVAALALQSPDEDAVAGLEVGPLRGFGAEREAGGIVGRADVAEALGRIFLLAVGERRIEGGENRPLREGLIDHRAGRCFAAEAISGDAVDLGRQRLLDLRQHLVGVPVGEVIRDARPEIELGLLEAVIDVVGEHAALRPARERGDLHALAPFRRRVGGVSGRRRQRADQRDADGEPIILATVVQHSILPRCPFASKGLARVLDAKK